MSIKNEKLLALLSKIPSAIKDEGTKCLEQEDIKLTKNPEHQTDHDNLFKNIYLAFNQKRLRLKALKQKESYNILKTEMYEFDQAFCKAFPEFNNGELPHHPKPESVYKLCYKGLKSFFLKTKQNQPDHSNHHNQAVFSNLNSYRP
ncbi:hypothetical protein [Rickettsiella massiliensis]|uniref:hypothetical protein n=1 Tax=Rickettsiella massiliensis TaxID=676517 RepID=UPI00029B141A|nr:hypothetical protein [Rickettsiella massiliensis]